MSANNITFILHKPQLSENIGACARGIKNFNFQKLSVIDPRPIFPNDKILATSVGAKNIINKSKVFDTLEPALKNIDYVIATSARFRNKNIKHIQLEDLKLVDYKVRILNTGTEAVTRVSIESTDSKGVNWFTIGVSPNIIDASFKALVDSLDYKLFKDKAPASL